MTALRELWITRRNMVLTLAAAVLVAVVAIVMLLWLVGRGAESSNDASDANTMLEGRPVSEGITAAGGSCEASGAIDRRNCTLDGVTFQLSEGTWVRQSGERERQCMQGQASRQTKILTNRSWMVYADDEDQLMKIKDHLSDNGVDSEIVGYCDWDE
ncbi:hypothetical protein [Gordonia sp. KTR9]|uniref:hypothetical protein n=2 Tax=Gordonia TaxID=2053 RepID=UPI0001DDAA7E|nr:hypothetical protein [Gordonia sp. KTR9]ADK68923.1 hypothetical protein KTR9_4842 [Gordonia sp. KTR9]